MFNQIGTIHNYFFLLIFVCNISLTNYAAAYNKITVIGIGKLGLCASLCFEQAGYEVMGIDIDQAYVNSLNNKTFHSLEPHVNTLLQNSIHFTASCSLDEGLAFSDIYYIMVDTPTTPEKEAYDHAKLNRILSEINKRNVANKHIIISCTIFPGYIRTTGNDLIKDCIHTTLSYNPAFIAQGNIVYGLQYPDIILIGQGSPEAGDIIESIHHRICKNTPQVCRMSPDSAEITKLAVNCFITTKIAYANMVADIADNTPGADKYDILYAIGHDARIGSLCLKPGYGFGGPCFPRDNRALGSYAQLVGIEPLIPQATDTANKLHAHYMANRLLDDNQTVYTFQQVAYKDNCQVPIIEESQKLAVAATLARKGKNVLIVDTEPVIKEVQKSFGNLFEYQIISTIEKL
ncbi:MAG TPA: nucleotide sugar dehydrogenase [Candidatus Babeliales bacterium]|jgi:nucleotide sugar dehydrogenase|nr:nucleotide sugar dehydrogenase [Candidatus Babeliales bacterium]